MATDDESKPGGESPPPEHARGGSKRNAGRDRGERSSGPAVSARELAAALRQLAYEDPAAFRSLVGGAQAAADRGPETPKLGPVLEQIPVENIDDVVGAIEQGLQDVEEARERRRALSGEEQAELFARIEAAAPGLPAAMAANDRYRGKTFPHSLLAAKGWLEHRHGPAAVAGGREVRR